MTIKMFTVKMIRDVCRASAPYHERIGKMFPKKGKEFPPEMKGITAHELATEIGKTLRKELGSKHMAAIIVARWTGTNEKTAKNWLAGTHCPSGPHLISLARESEAVMATLLVLAKRELIVSALSLISLRVGLMYAVNAIDEAIDSSA